MTNMTLLCTALLVILYAALSMNVSGMRLKRRRNAGVTEADLTKAIRAHGNASEYIPLFVALLLYLNTVRPGTFLTAVAIVVLVCRVSHAAGMFLIPTVNDRHPLRFIGASGTYVCLFALGGALLHHWFTGTQGVA